MKVFEKIPVLGVLFALLVLASLISATPFIVRSLHGNDALIGTDSYLHLGLSQNLLQASSYPLPDVQENGFHLLASWLLGPPQLVAKTLPIFFALLTVLVSFFLFRSLGFNKGETTLTSLILIISPLFIVIHTSFNPLSLYLFLIVLSWFVFIKNPKLGMIVLLLTLALDMKGFMLGAVALFCFAVLRRESRWVLIGLTSGMSIGAILNQIGLVSFDGLSIGLHHSDFLVSLGSSFGFSFFLLILGLIGAIVSVNKKNREILSAIVLVALFVYSVFDPLARVVGLLVASIFAAKGLVYLISRDWNVESIKLATIFLIILSVLFTTIMTITSQVDAEPTLEKMRALNFLKTSEEQDLVLSSKENGIFIERIARRTAVLDSLSNQASVDLADKIFYAKRIKDIENILLDEDITHILIDQKMVNGGVWTNNEQGLLFLLKNNKNSFVEVYSKGGVSIYRIVN
jgi:hypothetical protein